MRRSSQGLSAVLLIAGGVIGLIGNAMHPHIVDADPPATLRAIAANDTWVWLHVAIMIAIVLLIAGLVGVAHELDDGPGGPLARVAVSILLLGGALALVSTTIDGLGRKSLALAWVGAPASDAASAMQFAAGARRLDDGIWTMAILVLFGAGFLAFGAAESASGRHPTWVGWTAIVSGAGSSVAGLLRVAAGGDLQAAEDIFLASSLLITLWALALGAATWRAATKVRRPAAAVP